MTKVVKKLNAYLENKSQGELAIELGVNRSQITRWLSEHYRPAAHIQQVLNKKLKV